MTDVDRRLILSGLALAGTATATAAGAQLSPARARSRRDAGAYVEAYMKAWRGANAAFARAT